EIGDIEPISTVFADDETMITDGRRRPALSGFTLGGKARKVGQAGHGERFSAPQRVLKLARQSRKKLPGRRDGRCRMVLCVSWTSEGSAAAQCAGERNSRDERRTVRSDDFPGVFCRDAPK
ncbi:MAG: hypothetical protein AB7F32_12275, partial [Victivallaceae bacterium]